MKKIALSVLGISVVMWIAIVVFDGWRATDIPDVTRSSNINMNTWQWDVSGITLHIHGNLNGEAYVFAGNWRKKLLSGRVDWKIYRDWFQPSCVLHYEPKSVTSGNLTVEWCFE